MGHLQLVISAASIVGAAAAIALAAEWTAVGPRDLGESAEQIRIACTFTVALVWTALVHAWLRRTPPVRSAVARPLAPAAERSVRRPDSLRRIFDVLPEAVMVHRKTRLVYVNPALVAALGFASADDVVGMDVRSLLHRGDVDGLERALHELEQTGEPITRRAERLFGRGGTRLALETTRVPIELDGEPCVLAIGRALGERHLAERRFQLAVESARAAV